MNYKQPKKYFYIGVLAALTLISLILCIVSLIPALESIWLDLAFYLMLIITVLVSAPMQVMNLIKCFKTGSKGFDKIKFFSVLAAIVCVTILIFCIVYIVLLF